MKHTYTIHLSPYTLLILNTPNYKKIPKNALTQYAYDIHPTVQNAKEPDNASKSRPAFGPRKIIAHPGKPAVIAPKDIIPTPKTFYPKLFRSNSRNDVNKAALSKYFDNTPTPQEEWIADVVAELNRQDALRAAAAHAAQESLRQFVESKRNPQPDFKGISELDKQSADTGREEINANILDKFEHQMRHLSQSRSMKKMHDRFKLRHK